MAAQVPVSGIKIEFYYYSYFSTLFFVGSCFRFLSCRKSNLPQATRTGRPVALPQKQRQVICRVWLPCSFAALLLLSLGCRLPVVGAPCLLDGVMVELRACAADSRSWTCATRASAAARGVSSADARLREDAQRDAGSPASFYVDARQLGGHIQSRRGRTASPWQWKAMVTGPKLPETRCW